MLLHSNILSTCSQYGLELFLWLLGAFLLGYLLRWFLGAKYRSKVAELEKDLSASRANATDLEANLSSAKYDRDKTAEELAFCKRTKADLDLKLRACMESQSSGNIANPLMAAAAVPKTTSKPTSQNLAAAAKESNGGYAAFLKSDNLQVVEGIGPKIETLLKDDGINSWAILATTDPAKLSSILEKAGPRYRIHNPQTWPEQAKLANEQDWQALIKYQRYLGGGKEDANIISGSSKVEKLYMKARGLKAFAADDLKVVDGIGTKIESLLKAAGIDSHIELAQTSIEKIKQVLSEAGDRYRLASPDTWPMQARLASEGKWEELKDYQDATES